MADQESQEFHRMARHFVVLARLRMDQEHAVNIEAWEGLGRWELQQFLYQFEALLRNLT